ncbi:DUF3667 domain-containing protein [Flavobacterium sp.]|jgi:hypothetical protein|uniref:DUF3667 domain-containing protein n=1 Tax=Flavobacterium sp. TaxID=239 RepID=UPI0037BF1BCF
MSHGKLREDTTCQNCGNSVTVRFCPSCGQENTETKKSFHYLFTHFLEDLIHYDSSFWKAIKYLLFQPEKLTLTYLSGKRLAFMAPVRLFIFINIISFIIFNSFTFKEIENEYLKGTQSELIIETKNKESRKIKKISEKQEVNVNYLDEKFNKLEEKYTPTQIMFQALHKGLQNLPKWLFLIMPFFAFTLWLTHNKKKWWYFDHGIFTFHYFASFLLISSLTALLNQIYGLFGYEIHGYFGIFIFIFLNVIFIKAYFLFYKESWMKSILKLFVIYFLNTLIFVSTFILFFLYIFYTI